MPDRALMTATLIAKNEKRNVKRCLDSLWPYVEEVCVADTGSSDGTIAELKRYAQRRKQPGKLKVVRVKDCNYEDGHIRDFAAARQAADDIATGEWLIWADMDDEVRGVDQLRAMAANATADVVAFFTRYRYAADEDQNSISELWRERVVRNDGTRWEGRLHEHKLFTQGAIVQVDPQTAEWIHHRDHTQRTGERNLRILTDWLEDEPENPRVVQSIAMEYMGENRHAEAADMFARYLSLPGEPPDRRAQASRHMCTMLMVQGRVQEARVAAYQSLSEHWLWPDTHLTLAEVEQTLGRPDVAIQHAEQAMRIGKPHTLLIINPLQYTAHPLALQAVCLAMLGHAEEAVSKLEECLRIAPHYPLAVQQMPLMRAQLRKHLAVTSFLASATVLVEAGEPLKARALLDCVPFYVADDPRIVQRRGELHALVQERASAPRVAVADPAADEFIERMRAAA